MRIKNCIICGKEFKTKSYMKKTCSKVCSDKRAAQKAQEWKENNPNYHKEYVLNKNK